MKKINLEIINLLFEEAIYSCMKFRRMENLHERFCGIFYYNSWGDAFDALLSKSGKLLKTM